MEEGRERAPRDCGDGREEEEELSGRPIDAWLRGVRRGCSGRRVVKPVETPIDIRHDESIKASNSRSTRWSILEEVEAENIANAKRESWGENPFNDKNYRH